MGTILGKGFAQAQVHTEFIARVPQESFFHYSDFINATIRECNFAMGTTILGKGFAQAFVHTVHSTRAFGTRAKNYVCTCA